MRKTVEHLDPAASIIERFGGASAVAEITGLSKVQVWRWTQPTSKTGTGGVVPRWHQQDLLAYAKLSGIQVKERDFDPPLTVPHGMPQRVKALGGLQSIAHKLSVTPALVARWIATSGDKGSAPEGREDQWERIGEWANAVGLLLHELSPAA